jgi:hypothetical protein
MIPAILAGPLLAKIISVVTLAAQGIPGAIAAVKAWQAKDEITLADLERDADEILAAHNRLQNS